MKELVGLYAMLANEGVWYPLRSLKSEPHAPGQRLFSREASFLVLDMLHQNPRSGLVAEGRTSIPVSWKTGTSSRYRDAWTVGVFGPYVLGVWLGNFDNTANPAFIGKELAAPLFFELVDALQHEFGPISSPDKHIETMNLRKVAVCKNSGLLPTRYCPSIEWTWFIPGKSPIKKDTIYREVAINRKTGLRTCHIDKDTRFEIFEFWPSDLLSVFKKAGIQRHTPPFFEADCPLSNNQSVGPKISSPQLGVDYIIPANSRQNSTIPLSAVTDGGVSHLFWFLGETFLAKTAADESYLWQAKPGTFTIRVVDDRGLSDSQEIVLHLEI
jgi:penicillin-binding protein 1C